MRTFLYKIGVIGVPIFNSKIKGQGHSLDIETL